MSDSNGQRMSRQSRRGRHRAPASRRSTIALGLASVLVGAACGGSGGTIAALNTENPAPPAAPARPAPKATPTAAPVTIPPRAPSPAKVTVAPALTHQRAAMPGAGVVPAMLVAGPAAQARAAQARAARGAARAQVGALPGWARPVEPGVRFTSGFGRRWGRHHNGVDFAGPVGTPIRAMSGGVVVFAGVQRGYGNKIEIRHEEGTVAHYGHLDRIRVEEGQRVDAGHLIGALGNTGRSTGPHLHLEIRSTAGVPVDPIPWLKARKIIPVPSTGDEATS